MDLLYKIETAAHSILGHRWVIRSLIGLTFGCCLWFWLSPREPGIAISVLGSLAAIVTFAEMTSTQKLLATLAIFALMAIEIRDIRRDRIESDRIASEQRKADRESFSGIAGRIDDDINQNQAQFNETLKPLEQTLDNSQRALYNTAPRAILTQEMPDVYAASLPFLPNKPLAFDINFSNVGTDSARVLIRNGRAYVGKLDDETFQQDMYSKFDAWWKTLPRPARGYDAEPMEKGFFSIQGGSYSQSDFNAVMVSKTITLYVISRIVYLDRLGRWVSDKCTGYQDVARDWRVGHPCRIKLGQRYRATWQ